VQPDLEGEKTPPGGGTAYPRAVRVRGSSGDVQPDLEGEKTPPGGGTAYPRAVRVRL